MTKAEFVSSLAEKCQCNRQQAEKILEAFLDGLEDGLSADKKLSLKGFGVFEIRERASRMGRNPATGEPMQIPAFKTIHFRPSEALKEMVAK